MTTLESAHKQWANRSADERFSSLEELHGAARAYRVAARTATAKASDLRARAAGGGVVLEGKASGRTSALTHHAFGQLAALASAPAAYLRTLPAELAADCVNTGLDARTAEDAESTVALLFKTDGDNLTARALTSERYGRIWNQDITSRLVDLQNAEGSTWQPAPAAFDGSRGLYLSDSDMFAFMVDNERRIFETDKNGGLSRGFFVSNSEVGAGAFAVTTFYYEYVCGNHRVWGASNVIETRIRHVGDSANPRAWHVLAKELANYADASISEDEAAIARARSFQIGATKDEVLDSVFKMRIPGLTKRTAEKAYALAEERVDWYGSPRTVWGFNGALTEVARDLPNASERVALEKASAKIMALVF